MGVVIGTVLFWVVVVFIAWLSNFMYSKGEEDEREVWERNAIYRGFATREADIYGNVDFRWKTKEEVVNGT